MPSPPRSPSTAASSGLVEDAQEEVVVSEADNEEPVGSTHLADEGEDKESSTVDDGQGELSERDKGEEEMDAEGEATPEYEDDEFGRRRKYSPQELVTIQARVRESLEQQGVVRWILT